MAPCPAPRLRGRTRERRGPLGVRAHPAPGGLETARCHKVTGFCGRLWKRKMKQAQESATGTLHSRCPCPERGTPAPRWHRAGEARPGARPAPSSQPCVSLLLTNPPCPRPRDSSDPPNPPGTARPGPGPPAPPARTDPDEPAPAATRLLRAPPLAPIGCHSAGPAPRGGAFPLPPIRAPRLSPPPARGSALFPPPLPASRTSPPHWIDALSFKTHGSDNWSEAAGAGSKGKKSGLPLAAPRPRPRVGAERRGHRRNAGGSGSGTLRGPGPGP